MTSNFWTATYSDAPVIRMKAAMASGVGGAMVTVWKERVEQCSAVRGVC